MKKRTKIIGLTVLGVLMLFAVGIAGIVRLVFKDISGPAPAYVPPCAVGDTACAVWSEMRSQHPYPYQAIAGKQVNDGSVVLVLFEPPPVLAPSQLEALVRTAFGTDLLKLERLRWAIGYDGWVEDLVIEAKISSAETGGLLDDPVLRDRLALLYSALFGTAYGADPDLNGQAPTQSANTGAPNLQVSARELRSWLSDDSLSWTSLEDGGGSTLSVLLTPGTKGAFASSDGTLIALIFPTSIITVNRGDPQQVEALRVPFRQFAVASDGIVGGEWSQNGETVIVGRARRLAQDVVPPLRFETFALLAAQSGDELSQSYERNSMFAGKLGSGDYAFKDWAPVYLSEPLLDTELGMLLNVTDQILKSWSEAGTIEYVYFTYPKPDTFPFGKDPLSSVLKKRTGTRSVLFNWNTSGSAVVVRDGNESVLTTKQTGALPVTYGSDAPNTDTMEVGKLVSYEDNAYQYFASLANPNLERVVQYTVLYQLFRAIAKDSPGNEGPEPTVSPSVSAQDRERASAVLAEDTAKLLAELDAGKLPKSRGAYLESVKPKLQAFRSKYPDLDDVKLANILANRFSNDARSFATRQLQTWNAAEAQLRAKKLRLELDIQAYNVLVDKYQGAQNGNAALGEQLLATKESLDQRQSSLEQDLKSLEQQENQDAEELTEIRANLAEIATEEEDPALSLDAVRKQYASESKNEPTGSIKTPSIVLSWSRTETLSSVGGHNLDARALHFEPSSDVSGIELVDTKSGPVLRYNPSKGDLVEAHATDLARAVEHEHVEDVAKLTEIAERPVQARPRTAALGIEAPLSDTRPIQERWEGQLGTRVYTEKAVFVDGLRTIAEQNDCCVFIANDAHDVSYSVEKNPTPPPTTRAFEIRDTPSMVDHLRSVSQQVGGHKTVVFFDMPEGHVEALSLAMVGEGDAMEDVARLLGDSSGARNGNRIDGLVDRDLNGQPSYLRKIFESAQGGARDLLVRLGVLERPETWQAARVDALDGEITAKLLENTDWDQPKDGVPSAISLSFGSQAEIASPSEMAVVAGFDEEHVAAGTSALRDESRKGLDLAAQNGASIGQYLMTVRNGLKEAPEIQMRRLMVVIEDGNTKTLLSRLETQEDAARGY